MHTFTSARCRVCVIIREKFVFKIKLFLPLDWANFDDVATESVPVAMDTSPWNQSSTSAEASSSSEKTEKWADFSNKIPQDEEAKDNWADFNDIKDLARLESFMGIWSFVGKVNQYMRRTSLSNAGNVNYCIFKWKDKCKTWQLPLKQKVE